MERKKLGRPTDNPKQLELKFRMDLDTNAKLEQCSKTLSVSKAEILRRGGHQFYNGLKK